MIINVSILTDSAVRDKLATGNVNNVYILDVDNYRIYPLGKQTLEVILESLSTGDAFIWIDEVSDDRTEK